MGYSEHSTTVVLRTISTKVGDIPVEGDRLIERGVHEIETHWHVRCRSKMIMQSGKIRVAGAKATVSRWITEPDDEGECYATTWTTEGAVVDGKEYQEVANLNWNPENAEREQA